MAAPAYTTDLITLAIGTAGTDTGTWDESGNAGWDTGGAMVVDNNLFYNHSECVSATYTKDGSGTGTTGPGTIMYQHGSAFTVPTNGAILIHHLWAAPPALNLFTAPEQGIRVLVGTDLSNFFAWAASGSEEAPAPRGGWANYAIDPAIGTPDDTVGTVTTYTTVGVAVSATAQARGNPNAVNAIRYGRCESRFTDGDIGNGYCTFAGYGAVDATVTNKWNLIDPVPGGFQIQGLMSIGLTGTSADFRDSNVNLSIIDTINVTSPFNKIEVHSSGTNVEWTTISITALGTTSIGSFEAVDNATILKTNCTFTDMGTFIYQSNSTINGCTFRRCGLVTHGGAAMNGSVWDSSVLTVNTSALLYTAAVDPDGKLDNTSFTMGAVDSHAIEFGILSPLTMTLKGIDFSGYSGTDANTSTLHIKRTTGTVTINLVGVTGTVTARSDGATVVFVIDPVTTSVTVSDANTAAFINGARVLVEVTSTAGGYPYLGACTVSVTTTTATVTHTAHGLATNDWVHMRGMNEPGYNGIKQIIKINDNSYSYTVVNDGAATGTSTSTFVVIFGTTNASGFISATYSYTANQPVSGKIRSASTPPLYRNAPFTATIDSAAGVSISTTMIPDG